ncbi:MAG: linear amide C-N hydrolase [Vulcanimicrobiota bacterium]
MKITSYIVPGITIPFEFPIFNAAITYALEYNNFFRNKGYDSEVVNNTRVYMITEWETFTDVTAGKLYYRTYDNPDIRMVDLKKFK